MNILEIICIFILPVLLIVLGIIPKRYRLVLLIIFSIVTVLFVKIDHFSLRDLGLRTDNISNALLPYLIFTLLGVAVIVLVAKLLNKKFIRRWWTDTDLMLWFIPLSILQEFVYRGYLMPKLESMFASVILIIIINTLLFTVLHIIYPEKSVILPLTFIAGLVFALLYYYFPNLLLAAASHSVLNFSAVVFSFFHEKSLTDFI